MKTERNKFLAEVMGLKWHELNTFMTATCCRTCDVAWEEPEVEGCYHTNPDFSTYNGFGKLITWLKTQKLWTQIKWNMPIAEFMELVTDPDKFADKVWELLKNFETPSCKGCPCDVMEGGCQKKIPNSTCQTYQSVIDALSFKGTREY